ncbi:MAG: glycosyltransferase [Acidobacteriota bacterium]|nr:glycosyltransferase [Acidobacteriota bacterium]
MQQLFFVCGILCLLAWLYLLLFHGRFWQVSRLQTGRPPESQLSGPIAVVIPARNEASHIGRALRSLLAQSCAHAIHIFVVDDNSTDGTADAARAAVSDGDQQRLHIISGRPLPPGWTGKLWAMQQGIDAAMELDPQFLLLTDADVEHAPDNVATLVSIAERESYDLVSFMVKLHCRSLAEKLLIPAFVFFFFMLYPPLWIRSPRRKTAGAAGGCILIRPQALALGGGIDAIRHAVIDDCALARTVKRSGGRVWLGLVPNTHSFRPYESFGEIERMIARTAFNQLGHSIALLIGALVGMALLYLLPFALWLTRDWSLIALGLLAYATMTIAYLPMVRFYGLVAGWALTLPLGAIFYMGATLDSAFKFWSGRGGEWKGRAQDRSSFE